MIGFGYVFINASFLLLLPVSIRNYDHVFFGPYKVVSKVGQVAYCLVLPEHIVVHDVFHVSNLRSFHGTPPDIVPALPPIHHGKVKLQPASIIRSRLNCGVWELRVQWHMDPLQEPEETWIKCDDFRREFPDYQLADELFQKEGGSVTDGFVGIQF